MLWLRLDIRTFHLLEQRRPSSLDTGLKNLTCAVHHWQTWSSAPVPLAYALMPEVSLEQPKTEASSGTEAVFEYKINTATYQISGNERFWSESCWFHELQCPWLWCAVDWASCGEISCVHVWDTEGRRSHGIAIVSRPFIFAVHYSDMTRTTTVTWHGQHAAASKTDIWEPHAPSFHTCSVAKIRRENGTSYEKWMELQGLWLRGQAGGWVCFLKTFAYPLWFWEQRGGLFKCRIFLCLNVLENSKCVDVACY